MTLVVLYLATLAVFLLLDVVMLTRFMKPLFERHVGDLMLADPKLGIAAGFYLFYIAGTLWFASWPAMGPQGGGWSAAALNGALLGFIAYGCYESVNMATLKGWSWQMVIADTAWGMVITAVSAVAGLLIVQAVGLSRA
jgi:uncharacterized membrane protein